MGVVIPLAAVVVVSDTVEVVKDEEVVRDEVERYEELVVDAAAETVPTTQ